MLSLNCARNILRLPKECMIGGAGLLIQEKPKKEKMAASNIQQTKPTAPKRQTYGKKKKY